ncbi:MAG: nitrogenase stabilizing/protective protein NifW [Pseudomonadota bacterium]|jgi:nitrogenase-stabilizing/protective protein|uniref:Nitrogenase-stabilizing/protective protein NifW n=1 Tax=Actibacterium naphthalenivorans TaxID=1614693 RepID=A0A840C4I7_9RHOB|nr:MULTISPECIES: nitrogenase stabilizing/protective protein NifW [Actibacterium]ALG89644.1 hypothetical protein TQ29_04875 [Actibacterium sp. EMB200-NS6]KGB80592.1 hypothetical protein JT55_18040 [Rhodovulum sp. NI22]MBB4020684.1 nitrogenase-stabilizing/protective protein [Actibacterium naphthalenivorans]MDY6861026.1 nitrogenase stabilizing/protective protein NifW [Pseudomonadota bacterium]
MTKFEGNTVLDHFSTLSSAEDFFVYLLLPFDQEVLHVARLHIMKRMGQYLAKTDFSGMEDEVVFLEARKHLKRAYLDFVESSPLQEKVFKVFADKAAEQAAKYVSIDSIALVAE